MKNHLSFPRTAGQASRQAHVDLPDGTYEREMGREGFFGPATHMYHPRPPTGWSAWQGPMRPRAFDLRKLDAASDSPWAAPAFLSNGSVKIRQWRVPRRMPRLARNADGDEMLFVHRGGGHLFCDYGHLAFAQGDYIRLPRSTMWRLECDAPTTLLMIEATNASYMLPDKGLVGPHAIFDPAILDVPALDDAFDGQRSDADEWHVDVKCRDRISTITYPYNPLDAVGWKGDLCPVRLNVRDIRPLMSHRYHLPPSAHTTFMADRFVICTFVPRPLESDAGALKVPFFHNNDDYDEVIFYHAGDFFSRDNIEAGMVTLHPSGFTHGPHPNKLAGALKPARDATDEYAVMIDTRDALDLAALPDGVELTDYVNSWKGA